MLSLSLSLSCDKHWEHNTEMSLSETEFGDVDLCLLAQRSAGGLLL